MVIYTVTVPFPCYSLVFNLYKPVCPQMGKLGPIYIMPLIYDSDLRLIQNCSLDSMYSNS